MLMINRKKNETIHSIFAKSLSYPVLRKCTFTFALHVDSLVSVDQVHR